MNQIPLIWEMVGLLRGLAGTRYQKDLERMLDLAPRLLDVYVVLFIDDEEKRDIFESDIVKMHTLLMKDGVGKFLDELVALASPRRWSWVRLFSPKKDLTDPFAEFRLFSYQVERKWLNGE